jgi:hypothetical protein
VASSTIDAVDALLPPPAANTSRRGGNFPGRPHGGNPVETVGWDGEDGVRLDWVLRNPTSFTGSRRMNQWRSSHIYVISLCIYGS